MQHWGVLGGQNSEWKEIKDGSQYRRLSLDNTAGSHQLASDDDTKLMHQRCLFWPLETWQGQSSLQKPGPCKLKHKAGTACCSPTTRRAQPSLRASLSQRHEDSKKPGMLLSSRRGNLQQGRRDQVCSVSA